jgi:hypothetical protein
MDLQGTVSGTRNPAVDSGVRFLRGAFAWGLHAVRLTLYAVLAVVGPFIVGALKAASVLGFLLCLFYGCFFRGTHFPIGFTLSLSVGCAVLIVLYYALMELLLPE